MEAKNESSGRRSPKDTFWLIADIFFVLILCFVVLFSTLFVTNSITLNDYTVNGYIISVPILAGTVITIGGYLCFMLSVSLKGYREVEETYQREKEKEAQNGSNS